MMQKLETLDRKFEDFNKTLMLLEAKRDMYLKEQKNLEVSLSNANKEVLLLQKVIALAQKISELKKAETTKNIEDIVSFGLQVIFEDPSYKFIIEDTIQRNQVYYSFKVKSDSFRTPEAISIIDSKGGGVVNIVSFLLRLIILCLIDKKGERFIALDEPFTNLSEEYRENLIFAIKEISKKLKVQLLIVSHDKDVVSLADRVYELKRESGETKAYLRK